MKQKKKILKKKGKSTRRRIKSIQGEDHSARRKYKRGGRIEAYTMGEALGTKRWPR